MSVGEAVAIGFCAVTAVVVGFTLVILCWHTVSITASPIRRR